LNVRSNILTSRRKSEIFQFEGSTPPPPAEQWPVVTDANAGISDDLGMLVFSMTTVWETPPATVTFHGFAAAPQVAATPLPDISQYVEFATAPGSALVSSTDITAAYVDEFGTFVAGQFIPVYYYFEDEYDRQEIVFNEAVEVIAP